MRRKSDSSSSWTKERVREPAERRLGRALLISLGAVAVVIIMVVVIIIRGHKTGSGGVPLPSVGTDVAGTVTSVSATSITIQVGQRATETASVTKSTEFLGQAQSISGIKVGDRIGAALTRNGGKQHAYALEDPFGSPTPYPTG
jgi:amino acid transporter